MKFVKYKRKYFLTVFVAKDRAGPRTGSIGKIV